MKVTLYGNTLEYGADIELYNMIRTEMRRRQMEVATGFCVMFYEKFASAESAAQGIDKLAQAYAMDYVAWGVKLLGEKGIFTIDADRFISKYADDAFDELIGACKYYKRLYNNIIAEQQAAEEYRSERKENRSRVEGAGFGMGGFLQSQAEAGALNAASWLGHSIANGIGNLASAGEAAYEKSKLYKDTGAVNAVAAGICGTLWELHYSIVKALKDNSIEVTSFTNEVSENAEAIINNLKSGIIPEDRRIETSIKAIQDYPYNENLYVYLYENYGDADGELERTADIFGCYDLKDAKDKSLAALLNDVDYSEYDCVLKMKEETLAWTEKNGRDKEKTAACCDTVLAMVEENKREVDGATYPDGQAGIEAARFITQMDKEFGKIISEVPDSERIDAAIDLKKTIESSTLLTKQKYLNAIDGFFTNIGGRQFDTIEAARDYRIELAKPVELLRSESGAYCRLDEIAAAINDAALEAEDKAYFESFLKAAYTSVSVQKQLVEEKRTVESFADKVNLYADLDNALGMASVLGVTVPEFKSYAGDVCADICKVGEEQCKDVPDAIAKYAKAVKHSNSYLKYITEKQAEKQSFFSKLKTSVTGIVEKGYEGIYNWVTESGTKPIPEFTDETKDSLTNLLKQTAHPVLDESYKEGRKIYEASYDDVNYVSGLRKAYFVLNGTTFREFVELTTPSKPIDYAEIDKNLTEICSLVNVKPKKKKEDEISKAVSKMVFEDKKRELDDEKLLELLES